MKKLNPLLLTTIIILTCSCSNKWHVGTGKPLNNLTHWKQDAKDKKDAKKDAKLKDNVAKY